MNFDLTRNFFGAINEDPLSRQQAGHAGWRIDNDHWYTRRRRRDDIDIKNAEHFGFTTEDEVYVRSVTFALAYDRGEITPFVIP